jgi:hypothetical protein
MASMFSRFLISIKNLGPDHYPRLPFFLFGANKQAAQIAPRGRPLTTMFDAEISNLHCEGMRHGLRC